MNGSHPDTRHISAFLQQLEGAPPRELQLDIQPLHGGLMAAAVSLVTAHFKDPYGHSRDLTFVVKVLEGPTTREAHVYERLVASHANELSPRLLGIESLGPERHALFLEAVRKAEDWPWRDVEVAQSVLARLACFHMALPAEEATTVLPPWDYDAELQHSALATLELLERCRRNPDLTWFTRHVPSVRRMVAALPEVRRQLLDFSPLGAAALHGDVHPGNALIRRRADCHEPVLIDWGRARVGSPLEDVSSWLQSLGYWEPEARRRHDTLLAGYLSARGLERRLASDLRTAYWLAGASNALSGALTYHLSVASAPHVDSHQRASSAYSARDWLRVLRRADASWHG